MKKTRKLLITLILCLVLGFENANAKIIFKLEGEQFISGTDNIEAYITAASVDDTDGQTLIQFPSIQTIKTGLITSSKFTFVSCEAYQDGSSFTTAISGEDTNNPTNLSNKVYIVLDAKKQVTFSEDTSKIRLAKCILKQSSDYTEGIAKVFINSNKAALYTLYGDSEEHNITTTGTFSYTKYKDGDILGTSQLTADSSVIKNDSSIKVHYTFTPNSNTYIQMAEIPLIYDNQVLSLTKSSITKDYFDSTTILDSLVLEHSGNSNRSSFEQVVSGTAYKVDLTFEQINFKNDTNTEIIFGNGEYTVVNDTASAESLAKYIKGQSITITKTDQESSIVLSSSSLNIYKGNSASTTYSLTGLAAVSGTPITWTSSKEGITVTDDNNGNITVNVASTVVAGTYTITATGSGASATLTVVVKEKNTNIDDLGDFYVGQTKTLQFQTTPELTDNEKANVVWEVLQNSSLVQLSYEDDSDKSNVKIKALGAGTVILKASTADGSCSITKQFTILSSSIELTGVVSVFVGETSKITATITPSTTTISKWTSEDETKITVDSNGKVTGVAQTTSPVNVCATLSDGTKGCIAITVTTKTISINSTVETLEEGQSTTLTAVTSPASESVTWSISDNTKATISSNGKEATVTAKSAGEVTIKAKINDTVYATKKITITEPASLSLNQANTIKYVGDASFEISAVTNSSGIEKWESSNSSVAKVTGNSQASSSTTYKATVEIIAKGTSTISVTDKNGKTASFILTVKEKSLNLSINNTTITKGSTATITAIKTGIADSEEIEWTVSDDSVISLKNSTSTSTNIITAKSAGTATITATCGGITKTINITVSESSSGGGSSSGGSSSGGSSSGGSSSGGSSSGGSSSGESSESSSSSTSSETTSSSENIDLVINPSEKQVVIGESFTAFASTNLSTNDIKWSVDNESLIKYEVGEYNELKITALQAGTVTVTVTIGEATATSKITITSSDTTVEEDKTIEVTDPNNPHTGVTIPSMMVTSLSFGLIATKRKERKTKKVFKI